MGKYDEAIAKFRADPVLFVQTLMDAEPDEKQAEIMRAVARGDRRVAVKSGHGVGKTTMLSWLSVWWISTRKSAKVAITAPSSSQLEDALLPEMKSWIRRMPNDVQDALYHIKADRIEFKPAPELNFISAKTSRADQPDAMQGVHADNVLLVGDEASGIPDGVYEASGGSMSSKNACMILAGNPVRNTGYFYDCFNKLSDTWTTFTISCIDCPRVTREYIQEQEERYGIESNAYRIRVLGQFPRGDDDAVIPMYLIQEAVGRDVEIHGNVVWGLDVARFGPDKTALCKRRGNGLLGPVRLWGGLDTMQVVAAVKAEWDVTPPNMRPVDILVDVIGVGGGVVDRLRELNMPVRGINVSETPAMDVEGRYANLRSQLWYQAREWLERRDCTLPKDDALIDDLAMPTYRFTPGSNKIFVQGKATRLEDYRGMKRSPNAGDAFILTFASDAAAAIHGSSMNRRGPLKRNISTLF